jgi:UDP-N-acetylglucosamine 3-dehydrogenase
VSVKVGIVSFAHVHAPQYAAVLATLDAADFVGVTDDDPARGQEAADRFGVRFFDDPRGLFEAVDAVVVCSENRKHRSDSIAALEGGVHVLCEKPICTTIEDARAMIRASEDAARHLRIAFPVRYLYAVRHARDLVQAGAIGRILAVNGTNRGQIPGGWFLDPEAADGGAVMDHTVHVADALRWILGAEARCVYAEVGTFFGGERVDDGAILTLEFEGGAIGDGAFATIDPSWSRGEGYPTWGDVTFRFTGSSGVLEVDPFARRLATFGHESKSASWTHMGEDMNVLMLEDFLRGVAEDNPSGASGIDGLRALEIVLAAYNSGEDHERQRIVLTEP